MEMITHAAVLSNASMIRRGSAASPSAIRMSSKGRS